MVSKNTINPPFEERCTNIVTPSQTWSFMARLIFLPDSKTARVFVPLRKGKVMTKGYGFRFRFNLPQAPPE